MSTYKVIRFFQSTSNKVIKTGLTLEEAQEHCDDLETSSNTCTHAAPKLITKHHGPWFDGYSEE